MCRACCLTPAYAREKIPGPAGDGCAALRWTRLARAPGEAVVGAGHRDPAYWINRDGCAAEQLWLDAQEGRGEPFADSWVDRGLLEDLMKESETTRAAMTKLAMDPSLAGPTEVADTAASAMDAAHAMLVHLRLGWWGGLGTGAATVA